MPTGLTKDAGWEIGVSRTVPHDPERVWALLDDVQQWLGDEPDDIRSRRPLDRIRLGWRDTIVQVAIRPAKTGTTIRFHQERLGGPEEREEQRAHWRRVLDRLEDRLG